jgi:hypothetical protein
MWYFIMDLSTEAEGVRWGVGASSTVDSGEMTGGSRDFLSGLMSGNQNKVRRIRVNRV